MNLASNSLAGSARFQSLRTLWPLFALVAPLMLADCLSPGKQTVTVHCDSLLIKGTPRFDEQVEKALTLLKEKSPDGYGTVTNYVGIIQEYKHSGMAASKRPPRFQLNGISAFKSVTWCAGVIAHDAVHSQLYHEYRRLHGAKVPDDVWTGHDAEALCLRRQLRVLQQIGAPDKEVTYVARIKPDYADVRYQQRKW